MLTLAGIIGSSTGIWQAAAGVLPVGMTDTRATTALGLTGTTYAAAVYTSHANNVARFERLPSEKRGLLLEGASTALNTRSSAVSDGTAWSKTNVTSVSNAVAGPFGGTTADSVTEVATANVDHYMEIFGGAPAIGAPASPIIWEKIIKPGLRNRIRLIAAGIGGAAGNITVFFDMSTAAGSVDNAANSGAATGAGGVIVALPGGWYKCSLLGTVSSSGTSVYVQFALVNTGTNSNYTGSAASPAVWVQNATLAQGTVPTSPIETTTVAVTRNADITVKTISPPAAGYSFAISGRTASRKSGNQYFIILDSNGSTDLVAIRREVGGAIVLDVVVATSSVAAVVGAIVADNTEFTAAVSIAVNSIGLVVNGAIATRDLTAPTMPAVTRMRYGHDWAGANHAQGHLIFAPDGTIWLPPRNDAALVALATEWSGASSLPLVAALQADLAVDIIGVNTHFDFGGSIYDVHFADWAKPRLTELGVRHIRDHGGDGDGVTTENRYKELRTDLGITALLIAQPGGGTPAYGRTLNAAVAGTIDAMEPRNENDVNGGASWAEDNETFGEDLYANMAGNGASSSWYRLGPSFANTLNSPAAQLAAWPDSAASIVVGNMHPYSGVAPELALGGGWGISMVDAIAAYRILLAPGSPMWFTEIGYQITGAVPGHPSVTERAAAKYVLRSIMYAMQLGVSRFYIYELMQHSGNWGLVSSSNVVRQDFTAIKNWIARMADPGIVFAPASLNYSLIGDQTDIRQMLFQKRNGRFYLVLWLAVNSSSGTTDATQADVESTARALTLITSTSWTTINIYEPTFGTATVASFSSVSQCSLNVDDHICLVEMIP